MYVSKVYSSEQKLVISNFLKSQSDMAAEQVREEHINSTGLRKGQKNVKQLVNANESQHSNEL